MNTPKITYRVYGGKASIAKWIVSHFPEHRVYVEPFCASAAVLLAKPKSFIEVINDLDKRVINMWQAIKSHPQELAALLWSTPYSKANWRDQPPPSDIEDAALLMAQSAQYYTGNGNTSTWSLDKCSAKHKPKGSVFADWFLRILPAANRLRDVAILNEDALQVIERVYKDGPDVLLYVDPPYFGHEDEYRHRVDYSGLVKLLNAATAKVVVSEFPTADHLFKGWRRIEKTTASRAGTGAHNYSGKKKKEVLYLNYE